VNESALFEHAEDETTPGEQPDYLLDPDILNEDCQSIADWTNVSTGTAVVDIDPAGQIRMDTHESAVSNYYAMLERTLIIPPDKFTVEISTFFNSLGTIANIDHFRIAYVMIGWTLRINLASNGLFVTKAANVSVEVGTDIVKCNSGAEWQLWRFQVDKSAGVAFATVEVFLDNVSQGVYDADFETGTSPRTFRLYAYGFATDNIQCHIRSIKIATGLGRIR
jgi:hypothetical protein